MSPLSNNCKIPEFHTAHDETYVLNRTPTDVKVMIASLSESEHSSHICTACYEAFFKGDCTVTVADTVRIIKHSQESDWIEIEVVDDKRTG